MKCLSVKQPWAAYIVLGAKDVENRTWRTSYRGPLLIHAGKSRENALMDLAAENPERNALVGESVLRIDPEDYKHALKVIEAAFTHGAIIGMVTMAYVGHENLSLWWDGRPFIAWHFESPVVFDAPIPYKGRLGLFDVPDELVREALRSVTP